MTLDTDSKDIVAVSAVNKLANRENVLQAADPIKPVAEISAIINNYNAIAAPIANRVIGSITANITTARNARANRRSATLLLTPKLPPPLLQTRVAR